MDPDRLRERLSDRLAFAAAEAPEVRLGEVRRRDGHTLHAVGYRGAEGDVPAWLLAPARPTGAAVLLHHQHRSQWHWGKAEAAGLAGDPLQWFGPELARRGITVLAPDAAGFEDRRRGGPGTDPRESDKDDYLAAAHHRLLDGRTLMAAVLADAAIGHAVLAARPEVDPGRIGDLGHSMGGTTALFHAALDERVAFAASSCAACSYRQRMADGTGIEAASVIPGILALADLGEITGLIAPRPLLLVSATDDPYSRDAPAVEATARAAYEALGAGDALGHRRFTGAHALDAERFRVLVDWVEAAAG
jgi:dienelactone hydrolase